MSHQGTIPDVERRHERLPERIDEDHEAQQRPGALHVVEQWIDASVSDINWKWEGVPEWSDPMSSRISINYI